MMNAKDWFQLLLSSIMMVLRVAMIIMVRMAQLGITVYSWFDWLNKFQLVSTGFSWSYSSGWNKCGCRTIRLRTLPKPSFFGDSSCRDPNVEIFGYCSLLDLPEYPC